MFLFKLSNKSCFNDISICAASKYKNNMLCLKETVYIHFEESSFGCVGLHNVVYIMFCKKLQKCIC